MFWSGIGPENATFYPTGVLLPTMHNVDRDSTLTLLVPVENEVFSDIQCKLDISANCNSEAVAVKKKFTSWNPNRPDFIRHAENSSGRVVLGIWWLMGIKRHSLLICFKFGKQVKDDYGLYFCLDWCDSVTMVLSWTYVPLAFRETVCSRERSTIFPEIVCVVYLLLSNCMELGRWYRPGAMSNVLWHQLHSSWTHVLTCFSTHLKSIDNITW